MTTEPEYIGDCSSIPQTQVRHLGPMLEQERTITYDSFRRGVGGEQLDRWAVDHGYELHAKRGLTLKSDWHVSYHASCFNGKRCYYLVWSAYEHIWVFGGMSA